VSGGSTVHRVVGHTYPTCDGVAKVTGALTYCSDMELPGMLHAKLLLSPIPHGIVTHIDTRTAMEIEGVAGVFTYRDVPKRPYSRIRIVPGQAMCPENETLLSRHVRFVGDRIAAVVAESREAAAAAAGLIGVEYTTLPAALTTDEALRSGAAPIHEHGNVLYEHEAEVGQSMGPADDAVVVTTTVSTPRVHHAAMEPHACVADYDRCTGRLTIWSISQGVWGVRTVVADLLGLPYDRVRVLKVPMGGSFGGKTQFVMEPITAFLALRLGRPVKLVFDREECMIATLSRPVTTSRVTTVVSPDGRLRGVDIDTVVDAGGFSASNPSYAVAMTEKLTRLYRTPHYHHLSRAVATNGPVGGAARGWGAPEILTPVEIHMDLVARRLGMDPVQFRLQNLIHPYDVDPVAGLSLGDARVRECLERGAEAFQWRRRREAAGGRDRFCRGVGVACGAHKNGSFGFSWPESSSVAMRMNEDGTITMIASLHDPGCGLVTAMKLIAAEVLGIGPGRISAAEADTDTSPYDEGTFGSRVTYVTGACVKAAAEQLRSAILTVAAGVLETDASLLSTEGGLVYVADDPGRRVSFGELAVESGCGFLADMSVSTTYRPHSNPGAYAVQFAEVEVDRLTGLTRVVDFLSVSDVGCAINRGMVEEQFRGAAHMGIGYALCEHLDMDARGRAGAGGFKNYHLVNTPDMPDVRVILVEHEADEGPFGAKSVGEVSVVPIAATVINAVNHALGTAIVDLPATPEVIVAALHDAGLPQGDDS